MTELLKEILNGIDHFVQLWVSIYYQIGELLQGDLSFSVFHEMVKAPPSSITAWATYAVLVIIACYVMHLCSNKLARRNNDKTRQWKSR